MRINSLIALVCLMWNCAAAAEPAQLSLAQCVLKARETSNQLADYRARVEVAAAQYAQARALLFPELSLIGTQRYRSDPRFGSRTAGAGSEDPSSPSSSRGSSLGRSLAEVQLNVRQPIFSGFSDLLLERAFDLGVQASQQDSVRMAQLLSVSVAELFIDAALYDADQRVLGEIADLLVRRREELRHFVELGKSRESEVLAVEADLLESQATRTASTRARDSAREALASLIGEDVESVRFENVTSFPPLRTLQDYLTVASERPDQKAAALRVEQGALQERAVGREYLPQISLEGNSFVVEDPERNRDWEVTLQAQIPIFDSGRIAARRAEQVGRVAVARAQLNEAQRVMQSEVRTRFGELQRYEQEMQRLKLAEDTATKLFEAQKADYQLGVVTNLDVLSALQRVQSAKRKRIDASAQWNLTRLRLAAAAGEELG